VNPIFLPPTTRKFAFATRRKGCAGRSQGHPVSRPGFTLVELAVVLFVIGLIATIGARFAEVNAENTRRSTTITKMDAIETALTNFVAINGRLPCPATDLTVATGGTENRSATTGYCGNGTIAAVAQAGGVPPWRTLGLSRTDVIDGWNDFITYRVGARLTWDRGMNMSECDPAGPSSSTSWAASNTWLCASDANTFRPGGGTQTDAANSPTNGTCMCRATSNYTLTAPPFTSTAVSTVGSPSTTRTAPAAFLDQKGLVVTTDRTAGNIIANPAGVPATPAAATGAAYVLISHGSPAKALGAANGAIDGNGTYRGNPVSGNGTTSTYEGDNRANLGVLVTATSEPDPSTGTELTLSANEGRPADASGLFNTNNGYVDATVSFANAASFFDDIVRRPTIMTVVNRANTGPRAWP